jgi:uncharacterized membrane protein YbaN (DUF454 family)
MTTHPTPALIARYASGTPGVDEVTAWAVEAHLESCAPCRSLLADSVPAATRDLVDRVGASLAVGIAAGPGPVRRRRLRGTGVAARVLPWLATAAGLILAAVVFERTFETLPSLVLLVAPVAPLLPVAAAWSRRTDPAWELIASVPRAGLWLLLRRTLSMLTAVLPMLAVAGWWAGHSPAVWLLPCLAFTAGSLALGGWLGVDRAALGLALVWSLGVVVPSLVGDRLPAVLTADSWPGWAAATVALTGVVFMRAAGYRQLGVGRS